MIALAPVGTDPLPPPVDAITDFNLALSITICVAVAAQIIDFWWRRRRRLRAEAAAAPVLERDKLAVELTDLRVEKEVTMLAEAIARSDVQPGEPHHDRAQACLDAAAAFVDVETDRARVGCHILVDVGLAAIKGRKRRRRCFFHPKHLASTSVGTDKVTVPCCLTCADDVRQGRRPNALMVADESGAVAPYYDTHDVWTLTGYGALPGNFPRRVLLSALEQRVGVQQ